MAPLYYLNFYILAFLAAIGAMGLGVYFFYDGMAQTSFIVSTEYGDVTYYLHKGHFDNFLNGFVYCTVFLVAVSMIFAMISIPSEGEAIQLRSMTASYAPPAMAAPAAPAAPMPAPPTDAPAAAKAPPKKKAPVQEALPVVEEEDDFLEDLDDVDSDSSAGSEDADVVYGTGRVTEESVMEFIRHHPDSAVKFLFRKTLDGKVLSNSEEGIYSDWQKRGLSRAKIRQFILQIMEWESLPEMRPNDMWQTLRDQIFEYTHNI